MDLRIYLIGFMASGKSETGRELARLLGMPFQDLDDRIEEEAGQSIPDLFAAQGERSFRELESRLLKETGALAGAVIATGGGAPCYHEGMDWINRSGLSIFLDAAEEELARRLFRGRASRPMLRGLSDEAALADRVSRMLGQRRPCYRRAHLRVESAGTPAEVAGHIYHCWMQIIGH
jgi:shikimate kinase